MGHTGCCRPFSSSHPSPHIGAGGTPVAIVMKKTPNITVSAKGKESRPEPAGFHVFLHYRIHLSEKSHIPPQSVVCPGCQDPHIPPVIPSHRYHDFPLHRHAYQRNCDRNASAPGLLRFNVSQPLFQETADVKIVGRHGGKQGNVPGPSHSLITLRTISGDIHKIRPCPPSNAIL